MTLLRLLLASTVLTISLVDAASEKTTDLGPEIKLDAQQRLDRFLPEFPKSDPIAVFSELKIIDANGRFYRLPAEDWTAARQRVETDPAWTKWINDKRQSLDNWISKYRDRADWKSGWSHQFVSPKDGSTLRFTPEEPGETLSSPSDPAVKVTPTIYAAWINQFRRQNIANTLEAARLYRLTGEPRYRDWALAQLDFYADNFSRIRPFETGIYKGVLSGNILDDATLTVTLIETVRLLWDSATPEKRQSWYTQLFEPEARLHNEPYPCPHNIACWQRSAQALIALLYNKDDLWTRAIDGPKGLRNLLRRGVTSDYFWFEQSFGYNYYVVNALTPLFLQAARSGKMESLANEAAIAENLMLAPLYLRFDDGTLPNPADNGRPIQLRNAMSSLAEAAHLFPNRPGLTLTLPRQEWINLLDPMTAPAANNSTGDGFPTVASRLLESTQMAFLKNGPWQLFFHFGQVDLNHAQMEALNFEVHYQNVVLLQDPGTVKYGSALYKSYYRPGMADNVPMVNWSAQSEWRPGKLLKFDAKNNIVAAEQNPFVPGWTATRELQIADETLTDRVTLAPLETPKAPTALALLYHFPKQPALASDSRFHADDHFIDGKPVGFSYWKQVRSASAKEEFSITLTCDGKPFAVTFRTTGDFRVHTAIVPGKAGETRTALLIEKNGNGADFETVIRPVGGDK